MVDLEALPDVPLTVLHRAEPGSWIGLCGGGWFLADPVTGRVEVRGVDAEVIEAWTVSPEALGRRGRDRLTVDVESGLVVVTSPARTTILHRDGGVATVEHPEWSRNGGAAAVDPVARDRRLVWLVAAGEPTTGLLAMQPREGVVSLVDAQTGAVLDHLALDDGHPEGYDFLTADDRRVLLSGGYGQDGSQTWIFEASERDGRTVIESRALGWTEIAAAVDRELGQVLFMPQDDDDAEIHDLEGTVVTVLRGSEIFGDPEEAEGEPESFGYYGWFLDDERLVVATWTDRTLVLDRSTGDPLGWLEPGPGLGLDGSPGPSRVLASGRPGIVLLAVGT